MTRKPNKTRTLGGRHGATCGELLALLNEYVDGEVDPAVCQELEAHLAQCNPCQVVVDNIRKTITLYRDTEPCELPLEFRSHLHAALRNCWKKTPPGKPPRDSL
jgi:anti-sigma factor RsiW